MYPWRILIHMQCTYRWINHCMTIISYSCPNTHTYCFWLFIVMTKHGSLATLSSRMGRPSTRKQNRQETITTHIIELVWVLRGSLTGRKHHSSDTNRSRITLQEEKAPLLARTAAGECINDELDYWNHISPQLLPRPGQLFTCLPYVAIDLEIDLT